MKQKETTETREFDVNDPSTFDLYDSDIHGAVTIRGRTYVGAAAGQALLGPDSEARADERLRERQAAEAKKIRKAEEQHGPWLIRWGSVRPELQRAQKDAEIALKEAIANDPVGAAFVQLLATHYALDAGRRSEAYRNNMISGRGPASVVGSSGTEPDPIEHALNRVLRKLARPAGSALLKDAIAGRLDESPDE